MLHHSSLFHNDGRPVAELVMLLGLYDVRHPGTLEGIHKATQEAWYQAGKFRAEIEEQHKYKKDPATTLLRKLGFIDEVTPKNTQFEHAIVLGATVTAVRKRLAFLKRMAEEFGVHFHNIHLVGSQRPLLPDLESKDLLLKEDNADLPFTFGENTIVQPSNEAEMMEFVYEHAIREFPWLANMNLVSVPNIDGRPANTEQTLAAWNELSLVGGRCLVVSSQPYVSFQGLIARRILSKRHDLVECIGYEAPKTTKMTQHLDNIAKLIDQLIKSR